MIRNRNKSPKKLVVRISVFLFSFLVNSIFLGSNVYGQEDYSSLDIRNETIYNGDQEVKEFNYHNGELELFLDDITSQDSARKKIEEENLEAIDSQLFQINNSDSLTIEKEVENENLLFGEDYKVSEVFVLKQESDRNIWYTIFSLFLVIFGSTFILFLGWLLGRRFSHILFRKRE